MVSFFEFGNCPWE